MSTIDVTADVTGMLHAPQGGSDPMNGLRMQAGIFGAVDGIISALTGFSPLKEWVFKPVAGDWTALDKGADAWRNAAKAANELARLAETLPRQVGQDWQGGTHDAWESANTTAVQLLDKLPDQCTQMATTCDAISQAAQAVAGLIADLLGELSEIAIQAAVEAAIPVVGWAAEAETAGQVAVEITDGGVKIANAITKFAKLLEKLAPILEDLLGIGEEVAGFATKLAALAPKVVKLAETAAESAETIKTVADAVKKADTVKTIVDDVTKYGGDVGKIASTSRDAYDDATAASR